ncbi:MAG: Membrane protein involved in the export of O-antigen and teichoic acid [uncultured Sphingomonadaceae bacterium]|uniref:Membrane protein involved in the export of O-antigen and teichoic acid n=1 Tax=uncultured Sphingomonadaceae bacterium TaxID=169976 RepID=A0A6J4SCT7_9SPHN|nr:MAG: Membrane protein involved in the export of O-antigen and teichoic acid [uncultured Sphingomonadaceae bacterium]
MNAPPSRGMDDPIDERSVARGAGAALLARAGALIELVSTPAYVWMFGLATYGLYTVLWAAVNLVENAADLGMTSALQRTVPQTRTEADAVGALRAALMLGVVPCVAIAAVASLVAPMLAGLLNVAADDRAGLAAGIALFAWALPLWAFVEIATSALRARRAFGPEIRLRIVGEQLIRLGVATLLWAAGVDTLGLLVAHLVSLAITAGLSVRLLGRHYDLSLWRTARSPYADTAASGLSVLPSNIISRLLSDAPPLVLNAWYPGAGGAAAAGLYAIARKLSSLVQLVRMAFSYVLGPLSSAVARDDRAAIAPLYGFATRVSVVIALPMAAALIGGRHILLGLFGPAAAGAGAMVTLLTLGRVVDAAGGPAGSILQVASGRLKPLLGAALALLVTGIAAAALLPRHGGAGLAGAVALGVSTMTIVAVVQLWRDAGLHPFAPPFPRAFGVGLAVGAALLCLLPLVHLQGPRVGLPAFAFALLGGLWVSMRYGLRAADKAFMGSAARRLRL